MKTEKAKLAYIILAHKEIKLLNLLLQQMLADGDADIYIHIDKKNHPVLSSEVIQHDRIYLLSSPISVSWGDISVIDATLLLFKEVVNSQKVYDFVCLRSGQDLMTRPGIEEYLTEYRDKSFMDVEEIHPRSSSASLVYLKWPVLARRRYSPIHPFRWLRSLVPRLYQMGIHVLPNPDSLPSNIRLYRGSQWFCLSFEFVKYVLCYIEQNPWYHQAYKNSFVPDEWYLQTLIMNSYFAPTVINKNLTFIRMGQSLKDKNHPLTIKSTDIRDIENSENFFARKFDMNIDSQVITYFYQKITRVIPVDQ